MLLPLLTLTLLHVPSGQQISLEELSSLLPPSAVIVLAEKHDTPHVQRAQAAVIQAFNVARPRERFTVGWEFVDFTRAAVTAEAWKLFEKNSIDGAELLTRLGTPRSASYLPILEATRAGGGTLVGVNLTREQKAPVVRDGIGAADPALVPPGYEQGGAAYLERFTEAMGGHAPPEKLANYFAAQCLTDDVMAWHLLNASSDPVKFLVVGSFHADYFDGVARRLRARDARTPMIVLRFADAADIEGEDGLARLLRDARYGDIADFVVVAE